MLNWKLPKPLPTSFSQVSFCGVEACAGGYVAMVTSSRTVPGATAAEIGPTRTVTVTVCGASTACGSLTVRKPVVTPGGRLEVLTVTWMVEQVLPMALMNVRQVWLEPSLAEIQESESNVRARAPSP